MEEYYEPDDVVYWKNGSRLEDNGWKDRLQRDWDVNNSNNGDGGEELKIPPKLNDFPISVLSSWLQLSKRHTVQVIMSSMRNDDNSTDVLPTLEQVIVYHYQQQMARLQLLTESHASSSVEKETFDMYIRILKSFHLSNTSANVDGVLSQVSSQVLSTLVSLRSMHAQNCQMEVWEGLVLFFYFFTELSWDDFTIQLLPLISTTDENNDRLQALQSLVLLECCTSQNNHWDRTMISNYLQQQQNHDDNHQLLPPLANISLRVYCQELPYYDNPWQYLQQVVFQSLFMTSKKINPKIKQLKMTPTCWYTSTKNEDEQDDIETSSSSSMEVYYASILQDVMLSWLKVYTTSNCEETNIVTELFQIIYRHTDLVQQMAPIFWTDWIQYCSSQSSSGGSSSSVLCDLLDITYTMAISSGNSLEYVAPFLNLVTCFLTTDVIDEICSNMIPSNLLTQTIKLCIQSPGNKHITQVLESIWKLQQYSSEYVWQSIICQEEKALYWLSQLGLWYDEAWFILAGLSPFNALAIAQVCQYSTSQSVKISHGHLYVWYQLSLCDNKYHEYAVMNVAFPYLTSSENDDEDCQQLALNIITVTIRKLIETNQREELQLVLKALSQSTALKNVLLQHCFVPATTTSNSKRISTTSWKDLWDANAAEEKKEEVVVAGVESVSSNTGVTVSALLLVLEWARAAEEDHLGPQFLFLSNWQTWMDTLMDQYETHRNIALLQCQLLKFIVAGGNELNISPSVTEWKKNDVEWMNSQFGLWLVSIPLMSDHDKEVMITNLVDEIETILFQKNQTASLDRLCLVAPSLNVLVNCMSDKNSKISNLLKRILFEYESIGSSCISGVTGDEEFVYMRGDLCQIFGYCFSTNEDMIKDEWEEWCHEFLKIPEKNPNDKAYQHWNRNQLHLVAKFCQSALQQGKEWKIQPLLRALFRMTHSLSNIEFVEPILRLLESLLYQPRTDTLENQDLIEWYQSVQRITTTAGVNEDVLRMLVICSYSSLKLCDPITMDVYVNLGRLACQTYAIVGAELSLALLSCILLKCKDDCIEQVMMKSNLLPTLLKSLEDSTTEVDRMLHICQFLVILTEQYPQLVLNYQILSAHLIRHPLLVEATQRWNTKHSVTMRGYTSPECIHVDPIHSVWCTVIRIVATLLRSDRNEFKKRIVETSMDFLHAYETTFSSCLSIQGEQKLTPARLQEANVSCYFLSQLCQHNHPTSILMRDIHVFVQQISYFLGALGTARELFDALSKWNEVLSSSQDEVIMMEEQQLLHNPLLMNGIPNARHEAIRYAHYTKQSCISTTPITPKDNNTNSSIMEHDFQHYVNNEFTLDMEQLAAKCIYHILSMLQTLHPSSSCFHYFDNAQSNLSILQIGMMVAFYDNNYHLCYGKVQSWYTLDQTVDIQTTTSKSNVPFHDIVGMEDVSKRTCMLQFQPAPNFVFSNQQKMQNDEPNLSVGHIIWILRWCRQQISSKTKNLLMASAIAERCTLLLGAELSLHRELNHIEETTKINEELLDIYNHDFLDADIWNVVQPLFQSNLQDAKQRQEDRPATNTMLGGGHVIRKNKSIRRSPFRMFSR